MTIYNQEQEVQQEAFPPQQQWHSLNVSVLQKEILPLLDR